MGTSEDVPPRPLSVYLDMVDTRQDYLRTVDNLTVTSSIDRPPNHTGKRDLITNVNFTTTGYDDSTHTPAGERALLSPQAAGAMGVEEEMTARTDINHVISPTPDIVIVEERRNDLISVTDSRVVVTPVGKTENYPGYRHS